jgi:hypothetical protein
MYGVCISGSFAAGPYGMATSWGANLPYEITQATECEDLSDGYYGFYGFLASAFNESEYGLGYGVVVNGFDFAAYPLRKLETKGTTAATGNGKDAPHPGRKGDAEDNFLTIEVEMKRVECD